MLLIFCKYLNTQPTTKNIAMANFNPHAARMNREILAVILIAFVIGIIFIVPTPTGFIPTNKAKLSIGIGEKATLPVSTANQPPVANAGVDKVCTVGYACSLDGSMSYDSDGKINLYLWAFGDAYFGTGQKVSHVYKTPGTYTVVLKVMDNKGASSFDSATVTVKWNP